MFWSHVLVTCSGLINFYLSLSLSLSLSLCMCARVCVGMCVCLSLSVSLSVSLSRSPTRYVSVTYAGGGAFTLLVLSYGVVLY